MLSKGDGPSPLARQACSLPSRVPAGPVSSPPGDQQKAPRLLCVVCELFWMSGEEETGQSEWYGFLWGVGRQWGPPSSVSGDLLSWADVS